MFINLGFSSDAKLWSQKISEVLQVLSGKNFSKWEVWLIPKKIKFMDFPSKHSLIYCGHLKIVDILVGGICLRGCWALSYWNGKINLNLSIDYHRTLVRNSRIMSGYFSPFTALRAHQSLCSGAKYRPSVTTILVSNFCINNKQYNVN